MFYQEKKMEIRNKILKRGFSINLIKNSEIEYPKNTWETLDKETKKMIADNWVYLRLSPYSMFQDKEIYFDFSLPGLKVLGDNCISLDIPRIAEEDKLSTRNLFEKFRNKKINFKDKNTVSIDSIDTEDLSLIGMSFGKDSLLSYGLANELNLKPKLVMVQDFWDIEAKHKLALMKKFEKEFNEHIDIIYDELDAIYSYKRINITNSEGLINANAMNAYAITLLPIAISNKCKYIIFGNEQNFNDYFINKEGFKVYPSYDQSSKHMQEQNKHLRKFTSGKIQISSLIEPIYNIAEVKVLFKRYPEIGKYQMSCSHSEKKNLRNRWCYSCPMCAKAFLYLVANNIDPKIVDFEENFLDKEFEDLYPLFNKNPYRIYEKPKAVRDEQLFAFYLAYKNGNKSYLIEKFKKQFLKEAIEREDELYNRFFKIHDAVSLPNKIKDDVNSIYKEELK